MMTSVEIRQKFLDFFQSKGHVIVPSAPIVIKNDPTLMFTNAGMNQFKEYFLGNKKPANARVADTQKCLRVSGKHNDLEEVGVDTYHHTMFEMLGNWSFGDPAHPEAGYFKKEAIAWSWQLLTDIYGISKDRLYVTIFEGDTKENLPKDEEAFNEWKKWIAEDRILPGKKKDNFWEMGDTGPCGPCTEIHVDCRSDDEREKKDGKELINKDHPQVIEIWNNVFIQFNRLKNGSLEPLPAKHVDTGMGLERLVRILQNKTSNYDTDIFTGTINTVEKITGRKYEFQDSKKDIAFRVLADHIRAIGFTIADGQLPSNTGAGYVIRRILRRAVRYYYSFLDYKQPLLHQLMPGLGKQFQHVFPELQKQIDFVCKVIREEEEAFLRTLEKGIQRFNKYLDEKINPKRVGSLEEGLQRGHEFDSIPHEEEIIEGSFVFELYDTYGFPFDLTALMAREIEIDVDEPGFNVEMQKQKARSRAATAVDTEDWVIINNAAGNKFIGYDSLESKTKVTKYRKVKAKGNESYQFVLEVTPFYAESGGQVGDTGVLLFGNEEIEVSDTKKENDLIIHFTSTLPAVVRETVIAKVDAEKRKNTAVHHSATHLLHAALRKVLGTHVTQKGSLVNDEHLRFDFSHFAKTTDEEIEKVEAMVNEKIRQNIPVVIKEMPKEEALKIGAMALFGEKYGDIVRVVIIDPAYSVELCGGTHAGATGELGIFKITTETAVAAGVRRIQGLCGKMAEEYINDQFHLLHGIRDTLKNPKELNKAVENIIAENSEAKKKIEQLENKLLAGISSELLSKAEVINGITFIGDIVEVGNAESLKKLCFDLKGKLENYVAVVCASIDGKPSVAVGVSDSVVADRKFDAAKIIKGNVAPLIQGGGGGQKTLATAGGKDAGKLDQVINEVRKLL
jgi:alanyl-tRNA synthetase